MNGRMSLLAAVAAASSVVLADAALGQSSALDSVRGLLRREGPEAAVAFANAEVGVRPADAEARCALALALLRTDEFDAAVEAAGRCVEMAPRVSDYRLILGESLMEKAGSEGGLGALGSARRGKAEVEKAIDLDPDNVAARLQLFFFHMQAPAIAGGSKREAARQAEQIARRDPAIGVWARYTVRREKAKDDELARLFEQAAPLAGTAADSTGRAMNAAIAIADAVKSDVLRERYKARLYEAKPTDPRVRYTRARLWTLQGRELEEAEAILLEYIELDERPPLSPSTAGARWRLGQLYERQGREAEALEQYREALRLAPRFEQAKQDVKRLERELSGR